MANPTFKEYPIRKYVGFSDEQWKSLRKWIRAQRPKISEAEGLRRLVENGLLFYPPPRDQLTLNTALAELRKRTARLAKQPTRKRAGP